ncbi:PCRF domain-containing protein, partial [Aeromonas veronii]|nr:PCRF domain-containing protein [Aeromonas veronii]
MSMPDFWNDQNAAQTVINEANALKDQVNEFVNLNDSYENLELTYQLVKEEPDADLQAELDDEIQQLSKSLSDFEL